MNQSVEMKMKQFPLLSRHTRLACLVMLAALLTASFATQAQIAYRWVGKDGKVHYSDQPPPAEAQNVQQKKLHAGNVVESGATSAEAKKAAEKFPLTLYTSPSCKEGCDAARDFLNQRGVPFTEKTIQTFEEADEYKKATGFKSLVVPVLLAGSKTEKGFEENAWRRFLEAAGYPKDRLAVPQKPAAATAPAH